MSKRNRTPSRRAAQGMTTAQSVALAVVGVAFAFMFFVSAAMV